MKTTKSSTSKTPVGLVGRLITIDFHGWTMPPKWEQERSRFLKDVLGTRREVASYDGHSGEITRYDAGESSFQILVDDGHVVNLYAMDFTVQPLTPVKPTGWEYIERPLAPMNGISGFNSMGLEGWELVTVIGGSAYFKRPIL